MEEWLAKPVEQTPLQKRHAASSMAKRSKTNPRAMRDWPYLALEEGEYFDMWDDDENRKVQIREITALEFEDLGEWVREYRGYGLAYLKDGRRFAARGEAQYVRIPRIPDTLKERLDSQPWPPRK
jgi:hypothetical protein